MPCAYCDADVDGGCTSAAGSSDCLLEQLREANKQNDRLREGLAKITAACAQTGKDARHNLETVMNSRREADRRSAAYCDGILRVTDAVARLAKKIPA